MKTSNGMNIVLAVVICLILAGVLVYVSINNKVNKTNMIPNTDSAGRPIIDYGGVVENKVSNGEIAKTGDTVAMNYTGRLQNGTVFDSNVDPKFSHVEPFVFTLGAGQVIAGWDKGIVGMKIGEKKTLTIPPEDGYGARGAGATIPPNATLIFDVELLGIKK